jgi:hypothetical protein
MYVGQMVLQSRDICSIFVTVSALALVCFINILIKHETRACVGVLGLCVSAGGWCLVRTLIRTCVCGWGLARTEQTYYSSVM